MSNHGGGGRWRRRQVEAAHRSPLEVKSTPSFASYVSPSTPSSSGRRVYAIRRAYSSTVVGHLRDLSTS